jgi:hypothetical protein
VRLASLPAAAVAARVSSGNLPISNSCVDLLARAAAAGSSGAAAAGGSTANNSSSSSSSSNHVNGGPFSGGRAPVHLPPTAAASAAAASAAAASSVPSSSLPPVGSAGRLSKEGSGAPTEGAQQQQQQQQRLQVQISLSTPSPSLGLAELQAHQQAARASAVSHIRGMPDKPLVVLQRMVELMKVGMGCGVGSGVSGSSLILHTHRWSSCCPQQALPLLMPLGPSTHPENVCTCLLLASW